MQWDGTAGFDEPAGEARKSAESASKVRLDLLPTAPLEEVAAVLAFGANKYGPYNWCRDTSPSGRKRRARRARGRWIEGGFPRIEGGWQRIEGGSTTPMLRDEVDSLGFGSYRRTSLHQDCGIHRPLEQANGPTAGGSMQ